MTCEECKYAEWDYEEYYPQGKQWFICGCKLGRDETECNGFDENEE